MLQPAQDVASELLNIDSFRDLCLSVLERSLLSNGRFEAGQFGRQQHSSASAGAVLNGVVTLPYLSDRLREQVRARGYKLLGVDGRLRGHDEQPGDGTSSWSLAQVLLGLAKHPDDRFTKSAKFARGLAELLALQNRSNGAWPLRADDIEDPSFAFYPVILFERLTRNDSPYVDAIHRPLQLTAEYLLNVASSSTGPHADAVLALSALDRVYKRGALNSPQSSLYIECKSRLLSDLVNSFGILQLPDKSIQNELQPRWHSMTWTALLYACTRRWGGVRSAHNLQIATRLIDSYDATERGWRSPSRKQGKASSWASSLALLNVYLLALDISTDGITAAEYKKLMRSEAAHMRFDVVISFGGPDRVIAQEIRDSLVAAGVRVFFDSDFKGDLLGEDLAILLQDIYFQRSRFAIVILSKSFLDSDWAGNWEWKAVLARMNKQRQGYVLPYFLEPVEVPGLNPTIGYLSADEVSPREFAEVVARKVRGSTE